MIRLKAHAASYFKGIGQAFFLKNAFFGAGLLTIILAFDLRRGLAALLASLMGHAYSARARTPHQLREDGLITINGFFFGLAMASLFQDSVPAVISFGLGAMMIPLFTKASFEVLQHWKLDVFMMPYILVLWMIWLVGQGSPMPSAGPAFDLTTTWVFGSSALDVALASIGRLLFLPDTRFGLGVLIWLAIFSPRRARWFVVGTLVAEAISFGIVGGSPAWRAGHLSYCSGLVGLGLASFPEKFGVATLPLFCALSSFLTLALDPLLSRLSLPMLSLPFVLTIWTALLSRVPKIDLSWARKVDVTRETA